MRKTERNLDILELRRQGSSLAEIGRRLSQVFSSEGLGGVKVGDLFNDELPEGFERLL